MVEQTRIYTRNSHPDGLIFESFTSRLGPGDLLEEFKWKLCTYQNF